MRYNIIREMDIANGPGVRVSIFLQGCEKHMISMVEKNLLKKQLIL